MYMYFKHVNPIIIRYMWWRSNICGVYHMFAITSTNSCAYLITLEWASNICCFTNNSPQVVPIKYLYNTVLTYIATLCLLPYALLWHILYNLELGDNRDWSIIAIQICYRDSDSRYRPVTIYSWYLYTCKKRSHMLNNMW